MPSDGIDPPSEAIARVPERADVVAAGLLARTRMTSDLVQRAGLAFAAAEDALRTGQARDAKDYSLTGAILLDKARQLAADVEPERGATTADQQAARLAELLERARARQLGV